MSNDDALHQGDEKQVEVLDGAAAQQWRDLAAVSVAANLDGRGCDVNAELDDAASGEAGSPAAAAFRLWTADNLARAQRYHEALSGFDAAIDATSGASRLSAHVDARACALLHKAQAARLGADATAAVAAYRELAAVADDPREGLFHAGAVAESTGDDELAMELYHSAASPIDSKRTDDPGQLARRAAARLAAADSRLAPTVEVLTARLRDALETPDVAALERLVAGTHFAVGPQGGHTGFEDRAMFEALLSDLLRSPVTVIGQLAGSGGKRYLSTRGWNGAWYRGELALILTEAPRGWQWSGIALGQADDGWIERWRPAVPETNQRVRLTLQAPWLSGVSFTAGGLTQYIIKQAAVVATGGLLLAKYARSDCGFGPNGYYYNQGSTHDGADAFAIDFNRYRKNVPYDPEAGGNRVLATYHGIVVRADAGAPSGDPDTSNTVEVEHADPDDASAPDRYRSRYLHLEGPFRLSVSALMPVLTGQRLGRIDDTGNSVLDHLHFSLHDRRLSHPDRSYGRSVRPTPLSGTWLSDDDGGRCVRSTNTERFPGLNLFPAIVTFGAVSAGSSEKHTVVAKNTAGRPVTMSLAESPPNAVFRWSATDATIDHGEETSFDVEFHPVDSTIRSSPLVVTSTAPNSPHRIQVVGSGTPGIPPEPEEPPLPLELEVRPRTVTFGSVALNEADTRTFSIHNQTGVSVTYVIEASPPGSPISWRATSGQLAHGAARTVTITFRPVARVTSTATLTIESSTVASPQTVSVVGKGGVGGFPMRPRPVS